MTASTFAPVDELMKSEASAMFTVNITNTNEDFRCAPAQTLLCAMEALDRKGIPIGCRGGGCGICKVRIDAGRVHSDTMSRACVSAKEEGQGFVLACRAHPESDLTVTAVDRLARCIERSLTRRPTASFLARAVNTRSPDNTTEGDSSCQ
jgi:ferredoxin